MNKPPKRRTIPGAYDLHLMEQIEAQLALAREMTQLAKELRACVAQIERTLRQGRANYSVLLPEWLN